MQISSVHVGATSISTEMTLSERAAMNYAAAIEDGNPCYFDDRRPEGILAPPAAAQMLSWPITSDLACHWPPDATTTPFPFEVMQRQVHYTETLIWHRPLRPGTPLQVRGRIAAIMPHRAGTILTVRYDANDGAGSPVVTEIIGGLLRGVRCTDEGAGSENLPDTPPTPEFIEPMWEKEIAVNPFAAHIYDGCTNMHFPIHTSIRFAEKVKLNGIILQGAATLSIALREIINLEANGDPTRIQRLHAGFTDMVYPGTTITVRLLKRRTDEANTQLFFDVMNATGKRALSGGHAVLGRALQ